MIKSIKTGLNKAFDTSRDALLKSSLLIASLALKFIKAIPLLPAMLGGIFVCVGLNQSAPLWFVKYFAKAKVRCKTPRQDLTKEKKANKYKGI